MWRLRVEIGALYTASMIPNVWWTSRRCATGAMSIDSLASNNAFERPATHCARRAASALSVCAVRALESAAVAAQRER